jgi:hypothetical protein
MVDLFDTISSFLLLWFFYSHFSFTPVVLSFPQPFSSNCLFIASALRLICAYDFEFGYAKKIYLNKDGITLNQIKTRELLIVQARVCLRVKGSVKHILGNDYYIVISG